MSSKTLIFLGMFVGSLIGGYIPVLFGDSMFSYLSVITSALGALLGVWIGYKISKF
ncbi:MAG: hypothetical protein Q7R43_05895 [Candidatus Daviesbacteria bacterium]|nr:hypothetical protein [Candidatus Daviesbacteria bacterium]